MPLKVAILDDYQNVALSMADWSLLPNAKVDSFQAHFSSEDALVEMIYEYNVVIAMRERTEFTRSVFSRLDNLDVLITTGMRNKAIDLEAARDHKVLVMGTRSLSEPPAELTWGLLLALARNIPLESHNLRTNGQWQSTLGVGLARKTLGIIGLGRIGSDVARVAKAFYMHVIAWSTNLTQQQCDLHGVELAASKEDLLRQSDFVTIHYVLSYRSRNLLDEKDFKCMKPTAFLINTSRAALVNQDALANALINRTIAGAAVDVFDEEPLPSYHRYRSLPNLVATPHIGFVTNENYQLFFEEALENIQTYLRGAPLRVLS